MADDHTMLRNALDQMIEGFGGYKVVAQAYNGKDLIEKLKVKTRVGIAIYAVREGISSLH